MTQTYFFLSRKGSNSLKSKMKYEEIMLTCLVMAVCSSERASKAVALVTLLTSRSWCYYLITDLWLLEHGIKEATSEALPSSCVAVLYSFLSSPPLFSIRHNLGKFLNGGDQGSLDWSLLCNLLNQQLIITVVLLPLDVGYAGQGRGNVTGHQVAARAV